MTQDMIYKADWLKKQKATNEEILFRPLAGTDIRIAAKQAIEKIEIGKKVVLSFNGAYIPVNGKTVREIENEYDAWLEKQGESAVESINEEKVEPKFKVGDWITSGDYTWKIVEVKPFDYILQSQDGNVVADTISFVDEQFHLMKAKVGPKFKVGDFIKHNKANIICKVISVNSGSYYVEKIGTGGRIELFNAELNFHLWTIQDAKDGDVLATDNGNICVFDGTVEDGKYPFAYYGLTRCRFESYDRRLPFTHDNVHPATKEQRYLLFAKMKEAGYGWDAEKKELTKIEENLDELPKGEDYGIDGLYAAIDILQKTLGKVDGYQTDDGILSHKCAISAVKELSKQQPVWSALDERNLQEIIDEIKAIKNQAPQYDIEIYDRYLSWLNSFKDRYIYKPN